MNIRSRALRTMAIAAGLVAPSICHAHPVKLELKIHQLGQVAYLPMAAEVTLSNLGKDPIELLPAMHYYPFLHFEVEGGEKLACGGWPGPGDRLRALVNLESVGPGATFSLWETDFARANQVLSPGNYRIRAVFDTREDADFKYFAFAPGHAHYRGYAESNWVEIKLVAPRGEDQEHLAALMQKYGPDTLCTLSQGGPYDPDLLNKYLGSYYTAIRFTNGVLSDQPLNSPETLYDRIRKGQYLQSGEIPVSPTAKPMTEIEAGRWYVRWANSFLNNHPEAPTAVYVRLQLALHLDALGDKEGAKAILRSLIASAPRRESAWALKYLALTRS